MLIKNAYYEPCEMGALLHLAVILKAPYCFFLKIQFFYFKALYRFSKTPRVYKHQRRSNIRGFKRDTL